MLFCGRQSPGGHNVIWGLHDALKVHNPNNTLLGFLGKYFLFDGVVSSLHISQCFSFEIFFMAVIGTL